MSIFKKIFGNSCKSNKQIGDQKIDLEKLLSSKDLNNSIIEIDTYISELCSYGKDMNKLSEEQKIFYYNQCLEREINNGGFNQYFYNSSGDFANKTIHSLKSIGANKTAEILQKAIEQFPDKMFPENRTKRQEVLDQINDKAEAIWEELDQKFLNYEEDLNKLNLEYVKKNKDKF